MLHPRPLVFLVIAALLACGKKDDSTPGLEAGASGDSAVPLPAPAPVVWHLSVEPKGNAHVEMAAAKLDIVGDATAVSGSLDVVPTNLAASRGAVLVDLASFATHTFDGGADDLAQTKEALSWLKPSDDSMRRASFSIASVESQGPNDLTAVAPTLDGGDDVRTVTLTVHGDLLIHGKKVHEDAVVDVTVRQGRGAPASSRPSRVDVVSREPMTLTLKDADVGPRDAKGKLTTLAASYAGKVADTAKITVRITAVPTR